MDAIICHSGKAEYPEEFNENTHLVQIIVWSSKPSGHSSGHSSKPSWHTAWHTTRHAHATAEIHLIVKVHFGTLLLIFVDPLGKVSLDVRVSYLFFYEARPVFTFKILFAQSEDEGT
jgi:hypothetical protein